MSGDKLSAPRLELIPQNTYWGTAEEICGEASNHALGQAAYVNFVGGNSMVYPVREMIRRWPDLVERAEDRDALVAVLMQILAMLLPWIPKPGDEG